MNKKELLHIISQGENIQIEFKENFNKQVIETVVAFSNKSGGTIILGVNDKKETVGITITEETVQKWINEIKQNTEPSVFPNFQIVEVDGKTLVVANVDEFPLKAVSYKGRYYARKMNSNHHLALA